MKLLLLLTLLVGCATVRQTLDEKKYYKKDMSIEVNGQWFDGVAIAPLSSNYEILIDLKEKADLFTFTTCHREVLSEKAGEGGFFSKKKKVEFDYAPIPGIEDKFCPVFFEAYVKGSGKHSWGFIDFYDEQHTLEAKVLCNGELKNFRGVSACQARSGLIQEVTFSEPVKAAAEGGCEFFNGLEGQTFNYQIAKGNCISLFKGLVSGDIHRHTSFGYDQIIVREL